VYHLSLMGWSSDDIQFSIVLLESSVDGAFTVSITEYFELAAASAKDCKKTSWAKKAIAMSGGECQLCTAALKGRESDKLGRFTSATHCFTCLDEYRPPKV